MSSAIINKNNSLRFEEGSKSSHLIFNGRTMKVTPHATKSKEAAVIILIVLVTSFVLFSIIATLAVGGTLWGVGATHGAVSMAFAGKILTFIGVGTTGIAIGIVGTLSTTIGAILCCLRNKTFFNK